MIRSRAARSFLTAASFQAFSSVINCCRIDGVCARMLPANRSPRSMSPRARDMTSPAKEWVNHGQGASAMLLCTRSSETPYTCFVQSDKTARTSTHDAGSHRAPPLPLSTCRSGGKSVTVRERGGPRSGPGRDRWACSACRSMHSGAMGRPSTWSAGRLARGRRARTGRAATTCRSSGGRRPAFGSRCLPSRWPGSRACGSEPTVDRQGGPISAPPPSLQPALVGGGSLTARLRHLDVAAREERGIGLGGRRHAQLTVRCQVLEPELVEPGARCGVVLYVAEQGQVPSAGGHVTVRVHAGV